MKLNCDRLGLLSHLWQRDDRGATTVTAALTLPFLIIIIAAVWYVFLFLAVKTSLHLGVQDASRYLSEEGRYWNVDNTFEAIPDPDPHTGIDLYPEDFWQTSAKRVIANRLRMILLPQSMITDSLFVTVTYPLLAKHPGSAEEPVDQGYIEQLCDPTNRDEGEYRYWENIRFLVYATYKVPLWKPTIPWLGTIGVTLHDRAAGYVQCPRWYGKADANDPDKSEYLAREGPYLPWRNALTAQPYPSVTTDANATPRPTATNTPRPTERPSPTSPAPEP